MTALLITVGILMGVAMLVGIALTVRWTKSHDENENRRYERQKTPAQRAGELGENAVRWHLSGVVGEKIVFNNYTMMDGVYSTEIDTIAVTEHGVFVVEAKNLGGVVIGNASDEYWKHVKSTGEQETILNPVKQNATHVNKIRKLLVDAPLFSLVVLMQNNTDQIDADNVVGPEEMTRKINSLPVVLNHEQITRYATILQQHDAHLTKEQHIANVRRVRACIEQGVCPACGGKLVLRNGRYGDFYGCSNYPRCKFRKNIDK